MSYLVSLLENSEFPVFSAIILGLLTAISPCPLATNITAIAFIGKNIESKRRVFINGLVYTLGRVISYSALGMIIYLGASKFHIASFLQQNGEKFLGPLLVFIGIFMLGIVKINFPGLGKFTDRFNHQSKKGNSMAALFMGVIFALAFCPYSGVLYFGMLMPMTLSSASGLLLPAVYAIATGIPVIVFAYLIAFTISGTGILFNKIKVFEHWTRKVVAIIFIAAGSYFIYIFFIDKLLN